MRKTNVKADETIQSMGHECRLGGRVENRASTRMLRKGIEINQQFVSLAFETMVDVTSDGSGAPRHSHSRKNPGDGNRKLVVIDRPESCRERAVFDDFLRLGARSDVRLKSLQVVCGQEIVENSNGPCV